MPGRTLLPILVGALWFGFGCGLSEGPSVHEEVFDSAGVSLVHVSGQDRPLPWRFEEKWRAGGQESGPTSFSQLLQGSVAAAMEGELAVLDRLAHRVVILTSEGEPAQVMGREGQGPGELGFPASLAVLQDGSLWVYDIAKRGVVRFSKSGDVLAEVRIEGMSYSSVVRPGADGVRMLQRESRVDSLRQFIIQVDPERRGDSLSVPPLEPPRQVEVPGCNVSIPIQRVFAPRILWDSWSTRLVVSAGPEYHVDVHHDGALTMRLRRSLQPTPVSEAMAIASYPDGFTLGMPGGACTADAAPMVRAQGYAPFLPVLNNVRVAPSGEIWVLRSAAGGEPGLIDVWSASGRYEGTLPPLTPFPAAILTDGTVVTIEQDEYDVPSIVAWSVLR